MDDIRGSPVDASKMAGRIRAHHWEQTPLGPFDGWPQRLKCVVDIMSAAAVPLAVWWGPEYVLLYNDAYALILGEKHPHALGLPGREVWPEVWNVLAPRFAEVMMGHGALSFHDEPFFLERGGAQKEAWFEYSLNPIHDSDGAVCGIFNIVLETTGRVTAERRVHESERLFRIAIEHFPGAIALYDPERRFQYVNAFARQTTGLTAEEYVGRRDEDLVPPEASRAYLPLLLKAAETRTLQSDEVRVSLPGGDYALGLSYIPVLDDRGKLLQILGIALDLTERKRAEEALRQASAYTRSLIEASLDPLVTIGGDGKITDVNEAATRVTGIPRERLIGTDFSTLFTEPEKARACYREVLEKGFVTNYPLTVRHKNGHFTEVLYNASLYRSESGEIAGVLATARDITERRRAQEALRRSRVLLDETQRISKVGGWEYDVASGHFSWTDETYRIYGVSKETYDPNNLAGAVGFYAPEDQGRIREAFTRTVEEGKPYNLELRFINARNEQLWVRTSGQAEFRAGKVVRVFGNIMDITERKRAEEALRTSEAHERARAQEFEALLSAVPAAVFIAHDPECREITGTDAMYDALRVPRGSNLPESAPLGAPTSFTVFINGRSVAPEELPLQRAARGERIFGEIFELHFKDGEVKIFAGNAVPLTNPDGTSRGAIGAYVDITERKRSEEALERSERLLRTILEYVPVGIMMLDRDGQIVEHNPALQHMWGAVPHVGIGEYHEYKAWRAESGIRIAPHEWAGVRAIERGETSLNEMIEIESFDGIRRTILNSAIPLREADGRITSAVIVVQDITELRRSDRALKETNSKLERSLAELRATQQQIIQSEKLAALGTMAAGVAHELNNPLMGVMGYVGRSRQRAQDPAQREMLASAFRELERMRDLIKNLLGFARPLVGGKLTLVSVTAVLQQALALLQPDFHSRAITVSLDLASDLPQVLAKSHELQQVFVNLLLNSRDAVETSPEKEVRISARRADGRVIVAISDTGPGIPPQIQGRIFDPFFTTKPPGKGTGLGLSIARNIIADLGGTLTAESPGRGATFSVTLAVAPNLPEEKHGPTHDE